MTSEPITQWSSTEYLSALQHLTQCQQQITNLRTILPSLINPLSNAASFSSPEISYARFVSSATAVVGGVKGLRVAWEDSDTVRVLERAREGLDGSKIGVANSIVRKGGAMWWDDEIDDEVEKLLTGKGASAGKEQEAGKDVVMNGQGTGKEQTEVEDIPEAVRYFEEARRECVVEYNENSTDVKITVPAGSRRLIFQIQYTEVAPDEVSFTVTTIETSKLLTAIKRSLEMREHKSDLRVTMENLAAYKDLGTAKCIKCKRLLNSSAMLPTVRKQSLVGEEDGIGRAWEAFHQECL